MMSPRWEKYLDLFVGSFMDTLVLYVVFTLIFFTLRWYNVDSNVAAIIACALVVFSRMEINFSFGQRREK